MIFRVYEHYDDNQPNDMIRVKPDECFICYDLCTETELCPISLRSQINFKKSCGCDGWIHKNCLDIWVKKQKKCPICRLEITEINDSNIVCTVVNVVSYSNVIYLSVYNTAHRITIILAYCFLIYAAIEFYLSIVISKNILRDKEDINNHILNSNFNNKFN